MKSIQNFVVQKIRYIGLIPHILEATSLFRFPDVI